MKRCHSVCSHPEGVVVQAQADFIQKINLEFGKEKGFIFLDEIQRKEDAGLFLKGIYDMDLPHNFINKYAPAKAYLVNLGYQGQKTINKTEVNFILQIWVLVKSKPVQLLLLFTALSAVKTHFTISI